VTRVFFYHGASDRIAAACALIGGAHAKGKPVLVYVPDEAVAQEIDRALWTRSALSFVPHCRADSPLASETPIVITASLDSPLQDQRLMNLGREVPPGFSRFESLIEVVGQTEDERLAGRARVKHYRDRGYEVSFTDLSDR
jgi:DNA polymerase-3 subunit chi